MVLNHEYCLYYDTKNFEIIDYLPRNIDNTIKNNIISAWNNNIMQKILLFLTEKEFSTVPKIKEKIGHSMSTLHEAIQKLEQMGLINTEISYKGKKQKIIKPKILCVTKNKRFKRILKEALNQGLWVDTKKTRQIITTLDSYPNKYFTIEELSAKTKIPVDEIKVLLENYDSQITRALSDFLKKPPFEKKVLYRSTKNHEKQ